jgi:hypothetical protein
LTSTHQNNPKTTKKINLKQKKFIFFSKARCHCKNKHYLKDRFGPPDVVRMREDYYKIWRPRNIGEGIVENNSPNCSKDQVFLWNPRKQEV